MEASPSAAPAVTNVHVEAVIRAGSAAETSQAKAAVERLVRERGQYAPGEVLVGDAPEHEWERHNLESVRVCEADGGGGPAAAPLLFYQVALHVHAYQLNDEEPGEEVDDEDEIATYREWALPSRDFHGGWDALVFDGDVKQQLLQYAATALLFSDRGVDPALVAWNRVVLLHGPPGTGKTSLCKCLAQKLAIRFADRYPQACLVEVNAHSLFSKWFSESGKLVSRLFGKIGELVEEEDCLVFVLIDEVESLTAARKAAASGSEPSDAIRVVNAVLTHLDQLRARPNVFVLTTSNITQAIDIAFVDRADIKAYIGPPGPSARYAILLSGLEELARAGVIAGRLPQRGEAGEAGEAASHLEQAATESEGFSGRLLRKLPFLAVAASGGVAGWSTAAFAAALVAAVRREAADRATLASS